MRPTQLDIADQKIAAWLPAIRAAQAARYAARGRYVQLLELLDGVPANGELRPIPSDRLYLSPSDEPETWMAVAQVTGGQLPRTSYVQCAVDVYESPAGHGYVCRFSLEVDGVEWRRAVAYGPEAYMAHDWQEVTDGTI